MTKEGVLGRKSLPACEGIKARKPQHSSRCSNKTVWNRNVSYQLEDTLAVSALLLFPAPVKQWSNIGQTPVRRRSDTPTKKLSTTKSSSSLSKLSPALPRCFGGVLLPAVMLSFDRCLTFAAAAGLSPPRLLLPLLLLVVSLVSVDC